MCPYCENCHGHVTPQYVRVFYPEGEEITRCPRCTGYDGMLNGKPFEE